MNYQIPDNEQRKKMELIFFTKYQKLRELYEAAPQGNNVSGFVILNDRAEVGNGYNVGAMQFGSTESVLNTMLVALTKTIDQCDAENQVRILTQLSESFATRAANIRKTL